MSDEMIDLDTFRDRARTWLADNLERRTTPNGSYSEDKTPEEIAESRVLQRRLFDGGYAGISYPAEYGGRGLTPAHERVFRQEATGYVLPDFGGAGHVMFGAIGRSLLAHCTPEFLQTHIPKLLSGEELWCQFYSEPDAGSDLAGIRTRAVRDAEGWVINGAKIWSTGAQHADYAMCLARTNWEVPKHQGLTWFAVSTHAPGVTVRPIRQINGASGFCEEFLENVLVPDGNLIGQVDQGWTVTQTMLVYERGAGEAMGQPVEPRRLAPDLVAAATRAGRAGDPTVRQAIARAHVNDYAQYHLGRRIAARLRSSATPQPAIAAYGKLASGMFGALRARLGMEIAGPAGLVWSAENPEDAETATAYLNGRMAAIAAGTNEMQRNGIGERVLGLPREPTFDSGKPFSDVLRDAQHWTHRVS